MSEPYTIMEEYPDAGAKVILVRGERSMVQSLTPIDAAAWGVRLQEEADRMAAVMGGAS